MIVKAWNNGHHHRNGNGYGIKISPSDRDRYFKREWKLILVELEGESGAVEININKASFWNDACRELISVQLGKWMIKNGLAPWPKGNPPELLLEPLVGNRFQLYLSGKQK
jgi:hypothetical protein